MKRAGRAYAAASAGAASIIFAAKAVNMVSHVQQQHKRNIALRISASHARIIAHARACWRLRGIAARPRRGAISAVTAAKRQS